MEENEFDNVHKQGETTEGEPVEVQSEGEQGALTSEAGPDQSRIRGTRAGIITGVVLVVIATLAILLWFDPLNLHLIERLTGRYDAAMASMPADTKFYFGLDLRNLAPEKLDRVIKPFAAASEQPEIQDYEDMLQQIDESLERDLGVTLSEDIMPWIGQYLGIGLLELDMSAIDLYGYSSDAPDVRVILAIEARDRAGADAFLEKIGQKWTEDTDIARQSTEYRDVSITYWTSAKPSQDLAYTRVNSVVLIGQHADDVKQAIDAYHGESLADSPDYKAILGDLHKDRAITIFTSGEALGGFYRDMPSFEMVTSQFDILQGYAMTLAIVDAGVQIDIVASIDNDTYAEDFGTPYPAELVQPIAPDMIPVSSVLYLGGFPVENAWENYKSSLEKAGTSADVTEAIDLLSDEIGVDLNEFFGALDGVFALTVLPKDLGPDEDPYSAFLPFDLLLMVGTSHPDDVLDMLEPLAASLGESIMTDLKPVKRGEFTIYDVYEPYSESSIFVFGVGKEHLVITTSSEVLDQSFGGGPSLVTNERYQEAETALPDGMKPFMFVDVSGLVGMIDDVEAMMGSVDQAEESINPLQALSSVSMGVDMLPGPTMQVTILAIIQAP